MLSRQRAPPDDISHFLAHKPLTQLVPRLTSEYWRMQWSECILTQISIRGKTQTLQVWWGHVTPHLTTVNDWDIVLTGSPSAPLPAGQLPRHHGLPLMLLYIRVPCNWDAWKFKPYDLSLPYFFCTSSLSCTADSIDDSWCTFFFMSTESNIQRVVYLVFSKMISNLNIIAFSMTQPFVSQNFLHWVYYLVLSKTNTNSWNILFSTLWKVKIQYSQKWKKAHT